MKDAIKKTWTKNGTQSSDSLSKINVTILDKSFIALPNFVMGISIFHIIKTLCFTIKMDDIVLGSNNSIFMIKYKVFEIF